MVEICAGSAVLSAEAQKKGFQIFPIDHAHNRFRASAAILVIDLAHPDSRQLLPMLFETVRPTWCHMGLPCGTCSHARERPVSQDLCAAGAPNPRPLRGPDHLFGLPHLTNAESLRVDAANQVYITAEVLLYYCFLLGIFLSVENPERSWLWALMAALVKQRSDPAYQQWYFSLSDVTFDACMHGGAFPKATKLKATPQGLHALAQKRTAFLTHMLDTKKALTAQEAELRMNMPVHVEKVTQGKPLCLFRRLLEETKFPDMEVCNIMEKGVQLTGPEPESPLYFKKHRPAQLTPQQLDHQAVWRRRALMCKPMAEDEKAQCADLESESQAEVDAGFLLGPFAQEDISELVGSEQWSLSKRFALYQGDERKIRIIDNYRDSGINAAFSSSSYLALHDTDFVIGFLRFFMWIIGDTSGVIVPMSDGTVLRGEWHESLRSKPALLGRCVDLSKAYKQVAIATESLKHGVLGYKSDDDNWRLINSLTAELRKLGSGARTAAASLAGILNFCGGFVLGHALKPATHALSKWSGGANFSSAATNEMCDLIEFLVDASKPRVIAMDRDLPPIIVYTDGAFEAREGSWGALVIDPANGTREVYHGFVPPILLEFWLNTVGGQIICEVEMYAYLCVRWACRRNWASRCGICFIDNEACRLGLIKRSSPSTAMFLLLCAVSIIDTQTPFAAWMERVPSPANPADLPSRQKASELCELLDARDLGAIDLPASLISFLMKSHFDSQLAEVVRFEAEVD
eukprot:s1612_g17.t1